MRDIDLIPPEYLQERRLKRQLVHVGLTAALLLAGTGIVRLSLELVIAQLRPTIVQAERQAALAAEERKTLLAVSEQNRSLQERLQRLDAQRRPVDWQIALQGLDGAFGPGLWFDELDIVRPAGSALSSVTEPPSGAQASAASALASASTVGQTLNMKGHAVDHAGVTQLMERLRSQPALTEVRLVDTGLRRYVTADVIDFSISARITAAAEPTP